MIDHVFVDAKEVFYHRNINIFTMCEWLNDEKQLSFFNFYYIIQHLYLEKNFNYLKLRYTDPCNFLTKHAVLSQPSMLVIAKE